MRTQGLYPTQIVEAGKGKLSTKRQGGRRARRRPRRRTGGRVKPKALMIFTRQLATLIDSGLPLLRGLTVLAKQEPNPVLRGTINHLADSVQGGSTFSESLAQHPRIFNKLYVNMVKAGELGGVLEVVLTRLAEYQEKAHKLKNKIVSAMVYPVIVMFIAVAILVFLMLFIVPKFKEMFAEMEGCPAADDLADRLRRLGLHDQHPAFMLPNAVWIFLVVMGIWFLFNMWGAHQGRAQVDRHDEAQDADLRRHPAQERRSPASPGRSAPW